MMVGVASVVTRLFAGGLLDCRFWLCVTFVVSCLRVVPFGGLFSSAANALFVSLFVVALTAWSGISFSFAIVVSLSVGSSALCTTVTLVSSSGFFVSSGGVVPYVGFGVLKRSA